MPVIPLIHPVESPQPGMVLTADMPNVSTAGAGLIVTVYTAEVPAEEGHPPTVETALAVITPVVVAVTLGEV